MDTLLMFAARQIGRSSQVRDAGGEMRVQGMQDGGAARVGKALARPLLRGNNNASSSSTSHEREFIPDAAMPPSRTRHRPSFWGRHA